MQQIKKPYKYNRIWTTGAASILQPTLTETAEMFDLAVEALKDIGYEEDNIRDFLAYQLFTALKKEETYA